MNQADDQQLRLWFVSWPPGLHKPHPEVWKRVLERLLEEKLITVPHNVALAKACIRDAQRQIDEGITLQ